MALPMSIAGLATGLPCTWAYQPISVAQRLTVSYADGTLACTLEAQREPSPHFSYHLDRVLPVMST